MGTHLTSTNRHPSSLRNKISSRLPWTHPVSGISGEYTGQINNRRQPDGYGALVYKDDSTTATLASPATLCQRTLVHPWPWKRSTPCKLTISLSYYALMVSGSMPSLPTGR